MNNEMDTYDPIKFTSKLNDKTGGRELPSCPFCGHSEYAAPQEMVPMIISKKYEGLHLGPVIPTAPLICRNCGYINFFALGALGLLPKENDSTGDNVNGK